ncbi:MULTISPECIES: GNAT family N-acetyltransferase [Microbacterium]|uniref:N-acetyltransferase n=1 Tax=Microbacterium suwonense TaxID=683047 RepID=A0ABM8FWR7_9MICO|nr:MULTISPECIES: GNAT family N-acetyltransferase [Microbacterium]MDO4254461.1 GNAT family N-acetyltransferase [Kocuria sp.]MTE23925.1 GNAT family N-acetyltransferase [Microbacterium sp. ZXX196]RQP10800.1 MAG: N-acetyltransferase family protein [Microbacteriaceae bacterium]BDZ40025.1 N-acetyltransferase [Microbacterium suwonense]
MGAVGLRPMVETDWPAVEKIYRAGIATGHATFESEPPPSWDVFAAGKQPGLMLVAADGPTVVGWAAAGPVSARAVYRGVVEHSVYVAPQSSGRGVGRLLLEGLISAAEHTGIWTIQSSVFPENTASLRLHERAGFRQVGRRERIALMEHGPLAGQWRDTILLERRADVTSVGAPVHKPGAERSPG